MDLCVNGLPGTCASSVELASIPSPSQAVWHLGPVPLRAYALCILAGIFLAMWLSNRRWLARGGQYGFITDVAVVAVPMGVLGGRIYHVITTPEPYFGQGGSFWKVFAIWEGGLGIWGAIALGAVGAWIVCRRRGIPLADVADAVAPGLAFAQAIGRWGNWFNQELYGKPTTWFWGLQIDPEHRPAEYADQATFHPTYLYESIWDVGVGVLVLWADRRYRLDRGRAFALYVAGYTLGRTWIEMLRIDTAHHIGGMRVNVWVSLLLLVASTLYLVIMTVMGNRGGAGFSGGGQGRWGGRSGREQPRAGRRYAGSDRSGSRSPQRSRGSSTASGHSRYDPGQQHSGHGRSWQGHPNPDGWAPPGRRHHRGDD